MTKVKSLYLIHYIPRKLFCYPENKHDTNAISTVHTGINGKCICLTLKLMSEIQDGLELHIRQFLLKNCGYPILGIAIYMWLLFFSILLEWFYVLIIKPL